MAITTYELTEIVSTRTVAYLRDEMEIDIETQKAIKVPSQRLNLRYLTTVVTIGGEVNMNIIFSFDQSLIEKIFEIYTDELDVEEEERQEYIEETAGDMINIVVGNSTADFGELTAVSLTPPIMISQAKSIAKSKSAEFFVNHLYSAHGSMSVFCIGPKESAIMTHGDSVQ